MNIRYLFTAMVFMLLVACQSGEGDTSDLLSQIDALETTNEKNTTTQNSRDLIALYEQYVEANPDDAERNARFLYRAATLNYRMNAFGAASKQLMTAMKNYPESANTPNAALLLATINQDNFRNPLVGNVIYQAFVKAFPNHSEHAKIQQQLSADLPALAESIKTMGQQLYSENTGQINFQKANNYITAAEVHAILLPREPESVEFLYTGSQVADAISAYRKAIELYDWIIEKYPNSERAPKAMFLKAFALDEKLKNYDEARPIYEAFLAKYPNDEFAESAQFSLDNLGKSIEELMENFPKEGNQ